MGALGAYIIGGVIGFGAVALRWQLLSLLIIVIIFAMGREVIEAPGKIAAHSHVQVQMEPVQTGRYRWVVAYRLFNETDGYLVTSLRAKCSGGRSIMIENQNMAPGQVYVGQLNVPFAEQLSDCRPQFSVERDF